MFALAQNGTAAAAARVPIDNEQSKYFLFQLSFVSQSGGIPLSFLLSFHLDTFMQNTSLYYIILLFLSIQIFCTNCYLMKFVIKRYDTYTFCLVFITYGTIHILRHHIFGIFGPPYASMFLVLRISKNWHFLTPPTSADVIYEWSLIKD